MTVRVKDGVWHISARDFFLSSCEHCYKLAMAVGAGSQWALNAVADFIEPKEKFIFIQGRKYEEFRLAEIKASLPEGDFIELPERAKFDQTLDALRAGIPVIAQARLEYDYSGIVMTGYADLLVRQDYELRFVDSKLVAVKIAEDSTKYRILDIKNSTEPADLYWLQLATYFEALKDAGFASSHELGIVGKSEMAYLEIDTALEKLKSQRADMLSLLLATSPAEASQWRDLVKHCPKPGVCDDIYCTYPKLCDHDRLELDLFTQMYRNASSLPKKLEPHGITTVGQVAALPDDADLAGVPRDALRELILEARMIGNQKRGLDPKYVLRARPTLVLPEPSAGDLFFDLEWYPAMFGKNLNYIFGSVDVTGRFISFIANSYEEERQAFVDFIDFALARRVEHPDMHIYHWSSPEPNGLRDLAEFYGVYEFEAAQVIEFMVDLLKVARNWLLVGCGGYSLKRIEKYYRENQPRETNTGDGADSVWQYYNFLKAREAGQEAEAQKIIQDIYAYNEDDCLSTLGAYNWLRGIAETSGLTLA